MADAVAGSGKSGKVGAVPAEDWGREPLLLCLLPLFPSRKKSQSVLLPAPIPPYTTLPEAHLLIALISRFGGGHQTLSPDVE